MSLSVTQLVGFGDQWSGARYWRFLADSSPDTYWDLRTTVVGQAGVFESSDLTGTNIAAPLAYSGTLSFRTSAGVVSTYGAGYEDNVFNIIGELISAASFVAGGYLFMDFGQNRIIRSAKWRNVGYNRDVENMSLQWSHDNTSWQTWAQLTNIGRAQTPYWRDIKHGSTIAHATS